MTLVCSVDWTGDGGIGTSYLRSVYSVYLRFR